MLTCFNSKLISTCNVSSILYHLASSNSTTIGSIDEILSSYPLLVVTSLLLLILWIWCDPHQVINTQDGDGCLVPGSEKKEENSTNFIIFYSILIFWSYRTLFYAYQTYGMFVFIPFCWCYIALPQICCNRKMQLQLPRPRWRTSKTSTWRPSAPKRHWRSDIERRWHRDITSWTQDMTQHNPSPRKHT